MRMMVLTEDHGEDGVQWGVALEANPPAERYFSCCDLAEARRLLAFLDAVGLARNRMPPCK